MPARALTAPSWQRRHSAIVGSCSRVARSTCDRSPWQVAQGSCFSMQAMVELQRRRRQVNPGNQRCGIDSGGNAGLTVDRWLAGETHMTGGAGTGRGHCSPQRPGRMADCARWDDSHGRRPLSEAGCRATRARWRRRRDRPGSHCPRQMSPMRKMEAGAAGIHHRRRTRSRCGDRGADSRRRGAPQVDSGARSRRRGGLSHGIPRPGRKRRPGQKEQRRVAQESVGGGGADHGRPQFSSPGWAGPAVPRQSRLVIGRPRSVAHRAARAASIGPNWPASAPVSCCSDRCCPR